MQWAAEDTRRTAARPRRSGRSAGDPAARPWRSLASQRAYDPPTRPPDTRSSGQDKGENPGSNPGGRISTRGRRLEVNGWWPRTTRLVLHRFDSCRPHPAAVPEQRRGWAQNACGRPSGRSPRGRASRPGRTRYAGIPERQGAAVLRRWVHKASQVRSLLPALPRCPSGEGAGHEHAQVAEGTKAPASNAPRSPSPAMAPVRRAGWPRRGASQVRILPWALLARVRLGVRGTGRGLGGLLP